MGTGSKTKFENDKRLETLTHTHMKKIRNDDMILTAAIDIISSSRLHGIIQNQQDGSYWINARKKTVD